MDVVLALAAALTVAQTSRPDLVTLPLTAAGAETQAALTAWNTVVGTLDRRAGALGVSVGLQKTRHEFLVGPAREQAKDCGRDIDCLAEIGVALGADILVLGVVSKRVALVAIRVADRAVLAKARSPYSGPIEARARKAAVRLAGRLRQALRAAPPVEATAAAPTPKVQPEAPPPPPPTGLLYIHRDQLRGVTQLTLDGEPVSFTGEGFVSWPAPAGEHTLRAVHLDGRRLVQPIYLEPGRTTEVSLQFPAAPAPPPVLAAPSPSPRAEPDDDVLDTWWFWTVLGTAVVAGAATAAALAGGGKGGPTPASETGSIRGSY